MTEKAFYKTVIKQAKWAITKQTKDDFICWNLNPEYGFVKKMKPELLKIIHVIVGCWWDGSPDSYAPWVRYGTTKFKDIRVQLLNDIIKECESKLSNNA